MISGMSSQWLHTADPRGWKRWRRHALVLAATISLNVLIFLTIPFLSQIREAEPENSRLAGTPTVVSLQQKSSPQTDSQDEQKSPEPEEPKEMPQPDVQPEQVEFSPPTQPELPKLQIDMPEIELGRIEVSQPEEPQQMQTSPKRQPESKPAALPAQPEPSAQDTKFALSEVDSHPRLVRKVNPTYPFQAKRRGVEGKVIVRFLVDNQGRVSEFSVVQAEPEGVFEESALRAVRKWRFEPGEKDGKPVDTWVQVPIRFELSR